MSNKDIIPSAKDSVEAGPSSGRNSIRNVIPTQNNNNNNQNTSDKIDVDDLNSELVTHTIMHELVYQAPIADYFMKALLPLVNLVHFCLVFDHAFDWLREHDDRVKELCTSFDFITIYGTMPSFSTIQQIMKRFKPSQIKFGHKNNADSFSVNFLEAFNASKKPLDTLFINIHNPLQTINMYEISVNELIIKCDAFFRNLGANPIIPVMRSIDKNVKSITLDGCTIDNFVAERFHDFDLEQLRLLNCETFLYGSEAFFFRLTFLKKLTTLHTRFIHVYDDLDVNILNCLLFNNINRLQQLEDLEITIGTTNTSIRPLQMLRKLNRLKINIELSCASEFELPEMMTVIRYSLKHVQYIEIHLFSMKSSVHMIVNRVYIEHLIQEMHIANVKITYGFPFENED